MKDYYSDNAVSTNNDITGNYNSLLVHGTLSAGISLKALNKIYLLGSFVGYTLNNLSNQNGVTTNVLSYGVMLSMLLF